MYLIIIAAIVVWLGYEMYWKRRNFPPGPLPLPLIGNLHQFAWHQPGYKFMANNKKGYNPIYTWWMGSQPVVTICDFELMKDTFVKDGDTYTDKFHFKGLNEIFRGGNYGIAEATGEMWREHRRFALHQMRDLGLGKMKMEERILIEVEVLTTKMMEDPAIDIQAEFQKAVANVINQLVFGYRWAQEKDEELSKLVKMLEEHQGKGTGIMLVLILWEWTRKLPYFKKQWEQFLKFRDDFFGFFKQQMEHHKDEIDYDADDSTDYVEAYLKEQKKREAVGDFDSFSGIQLVNVVADLWSAGLGTTTATLSWGLIYLLHNPHVQDKIHEEMDRVIGSSRAIKMTDKANLPYMSAVVIEIQRALNLVVTNLPHATTKDVDIAGYLIKKGTTIIADVGIMLHDEKLFPDPHKFDPERFLDNGKFKTYPEVMPFSLGKRQCPGMGLATMELFLILANVCNRFKLSSPNPPSLKKTFRNLLKPTEFIELKAEYRF